MVLDYEIRKKLEEAWLIEMAIPRQSAIDIMTGLEPKLKAHIAKCFLFRNTQWYNHWLKECGNFCIKCDDIRLKPNAKRPDSSLYLEYFVDEMETAHDADLILTNAIIRCAEIERNINPTKEECFTFVDFWNDLRVELADYLSDEDTFDRSVYIDVIDKAIKRYPIIEK